MERYIAIDNVCAWPNLTRLPDGSLVATIFNQPCHGLWEGDVECWGSDDGGRTWRLRGTPAPHASGTNRMNVAAGLAANGDLLVIASGFTDRPPQGQQPSDHKTVLSPWVCRSADSGRTWSRHDTCPSAPELGRSIVIPFGDIVQAADGALCFSAYAGPQDGSDDCCSAYLFRSDDDGLTWGDGAIIGASRYNETAPFHLGGGRWLAVARTQPGDALHLFLSDDDGRTWRFSQEVAMPGQHPAHLLRLSDGRILLTYGNRRVGEKGIDIRISSDEGHTWTTPMQLVALEPTDLGYPSTAPTGDGTLCTVWYAGGVAAHQRYHMGALIWDVEDVEQRWFTTAITSWLVSDLTPNAYGIAHAPYHGSTSPLGWERMPAMADDGFINLHARFGDADGIVYLANRFTIPHAATWELTLGHDGGVCIFVDGADVLTVPDTRNPAAPGRTTVPIPLDEGEHDIVIAFDTAGGKGWGIYSSWVLPKSARDTKQARAFPVLLPEGTS